MESVVLRISSGCDLLDPESVVLKVWGEVCACGRVGQRPPLLQLTALASDLEKTLPRDTVSLSFWRGVINANRIRKTVHTGQLLMAVLSVQRSLLAHRVEQTRVTISDPCREVDCCNTEMVSVRVKL